MSAKSHLSLCDSPILIDDGRKSFALEKWTGRKCYMLSARDLTIIWSNSPDYWRWLPDPDSRFSEVAELIDVCWFEINDEISIQMLSPETSYAAYLVFKLTTSAYGFEGHPAEITVELAGSEKDKRSVFLVPVRGQRRQHQTLRRLTGLFNCSRVSGSQPSVPAGKSYGKYPKERVDGWLEIELVEFYNKKGGDGKLKICLRETGGHWKGGVIVQGIEIRPKGENKIKQAIAT
ncbi:hypothetical protein GH714_017445 [Hevea brasiliensis]|uniref:F-box domain-containing protein n=1 Tax=Hevea brasiliensis TaxID=3981 RepID=A0A6A6N0I3_HEVBR|nr:hypothetical protein GH714_017007 [Hevea brasiliensis]KAF2319601.1 hypothetical protein GH714_017445 [Hevea brasiliensis]